MAAGNSVPLNPLNTDSLITDYSPKTLRAAIRPDSQLSTPNSQPVPNRLPVSDCVRIGITLASALAHLHKHGLVHRDIKPSNIIFVGGVPKLADIGLVADASEARSFVGTVGFIPPEGPGSPQADLYSLGKVLYEISTGQDRQDFPQLPPDLLRDQKNQKSEIRNQKFKIDQSLLTSAPTKTGGTREIPNAPAPLIELNEVLLKACHKDLRQRYPSADAMLVDLELLERGQSVIGTHTRAHRRKVASQIGLATAAIVVLVASGWLLSTRFNASTLQRSNAPPEANSLAVLPFVNAKTNWTPLEYLSDALTDETMNALTNSAGLRVASRPAVFAFKRATNDLRQIGEKLGVGTVLTGTFLRGSNGVHLTARLVKVVDGAQLWSTNFERGREELGALGADLIQPVARALGFNLEDRVLDRARSNLMRKLSAYKLYSQAITNWMNTQDGLDRGIRLLNQAIAEDQNYAQAYAELAYRYEESSGFYLPQAQAMTSAKMNALRALELEDALPMAHRALAMVFWRHEMVLAKAKAHFERAMELAPNDGEAHGDYATGLSHFGLFKEADQVLERGEQVDPKAHNLLGGWCWRYYLSRDFKNAKQAANQLQTVHPQSVMGPWFRALACEGLRQFEEGLTLAQSSMRMDPGPDIVALLGRIHARLGHREEALKALEELRVMAQSPRGAATFSAEVLFALGENDRAIEHLQRAVDGYPPTVLTLKANPFWDDLRANPRFQALLKKGGLEK